MEKLKQAARDLLKALESDEDDAPAKYLKAKDHLAERAVLWAQEEEIARVEKKMKAKRR